MTELQCAFSGGKTIPLPVLDQEIKGVAPIPDKTAFLSNVNALDNLPACDTQEDVVGQVVEWDRFARLCRYSEALARWQIARTLTEQKHHYGDHLIDRAAKALNCTRACIYSWLPLAELTKAEVLQTLAQKGTLSALKATVTAKQLALGTYHENTEETLERLISLIVSAGNKLADLVDRLRGMNEARVGTLNADWAREVEDVIHTARDEWEETKRVIAQSADSCGSEGGA